MVNLSDIVLVTMIYGIYLLNNTEDKVLEKNRILNCNCNIGKKKSKLFT